MTNPAIISAQIALVPIIAKNTKSNIVNLRNEVLNYRGLILD